MSENGIWPGPGAAAPPSISANSFKALTARLKKPGSVPAPQIPTIAPEPLSPPQHFAPPPPPVIVPPSVVAPEHVPEPQVFAPPPQIHVAPPPPPPPPVAVTAPEPVDALEQLVSMAAEPAPMSESAVVVPTSSTVFADYLKQIPPLPPAQEPVVMQQPIVVVKPTIITKESAAAVFGDGPGQPVTPPSFVPDREADFDAQDLERFITAVAPAAEEFTPQVIVHALVVEELPPPVVEPVAAIEIQSILVEPIHVDPVRGELVHVEPVEVVQPASVEVPVEHHVDHIDANLDADQVAVAHAAQNARNGAEFAKLELISRMVYGRPTPEERSAFLKEAAERIAADSTERDAERAAAIAVAPVEDEAAVFLADDEQQPAFLEPAAATSDGSVPFLSDDMAAEYGEPIAPGVTETISSDADAFLPQETQTVQVVGPDVGETARTLLDMMASSTNGGLPHERALAADTLLRLYPQIPLKPLVMMAERLAIMDNPPSLLVGKTIRDDRIEVSGPLIENCAHITDQDLLSVVEENNPAKLRLLARRRKLPRAISTRIIATDDDSAHLTLVRNATAEISHGGFLALTDAARVNPDLLAPLATRADLSPPFAFELFWLAPPQLRRYILNRFLTDSETLNKILKITMATQGGEEVAANNHAAIAQVIEAIQKALSGRTQEAAEQLAPVVRVSIPAAERILHDNQGEALAVMLKAVGVPRADALELIKAMQKGSNNLIVSGRDSDEIFATFDTLSFNKARILLTYWDWAATRSGPYAPVH